MVWEILQIRDVIAAVALSIFFVLVGYRPSWWKWKKSSAKTVRDIPGPLALPVFGTRWIYSVGYSFAKLHDVYDDLFKRYGPIVKEETLFNIPVINILKRSDFEKVFKATGKYPVRPPVEVISHYRKTRPDRYSTMGLSNEQGINWHNLRSSLTPELISPRTMSEFLPQMKQICDDWCSLIKHHSSGGLVEDLKPLAERLGLEATCALVLGRRMGFLLPGELSPTAQKLADAVHNHFLACRDTFYGLPFWKLWPTAAYKRLRESEEAIYTLALELIESADEETRDSAVFQSVLRAPIDEREKIVAIVDFISAGIDTLGNSLSFLLYLMGKNPACQQRLLDDLNGGASNYLKACINEAFRLIPTAFCLARISEQDLELSGYHLKAGTVLLCHTGLACKSDEYFRNANEFDPERWIGEDKAATAAAAMYLFTPFGIGKRLCPGKRFVELFLKCLLTAAVQHFIISSPEELELQCEFILAPRGPFPMRFEDRL